MSEYLNITVYSYIYLAIVIAIFFYTIRNRLDILCVCAVCFVVYTMYCFFGYGISGFYRPKLSPLLYWLVYIQMFMILGFTWYSRKKDGSKYLLSANEESKSEEYAAEENVRLTRSFYLYTCVIVLFALINIIPLSVAGFAAGKSNVWSNTNVLYIVSLYGAYPSFAYGLHVNKKRIWVPSLLIELTIFFAGSRAFAATLIILFLCERGVSLWRKGKGNLGVFVLGASAVLFLLVYRAVDQAIMQGDVATALATLADPMVWVEALEFNEPRVILANYDYALTSGIDLPAGDVLYRILDFVPGLTKLIPIELAYPEYFSTWLQVEVTGSTGVGGTIWGESHAMFGVFGVLLFTSIWLVCMRYANNHLDYHSPYSSFVIAVGTYLAWYINRLDFNRVGQAVKVTTLCFLIWACFYLVLGGELSFGKRIKIRLDERLLAWVNGLYRKYVDPVYQIVYRCWKKFAQPMVDQVNAYKTMLANKAKAYLKQMKNREN